MGEFQKLYHGRFKQAQKFAREFPTLGSGFPMASMSCVLALVLSNSLALD